MAIKKITSFDRAACRVVGDAFQKMAEEFAREYGLVTKPAGGRFDPNSFTPKVTFMIPAVSGDGKVVNKKEMESFKSMAPLFGIDPEAFGQQLKLSGKSYTITGWNSKGRVSPIQIEGTDGKKYKVRVDAVVKQYPLKEKTTSKPTVGELKLKAELNRKKEDEGEMQKCGYCGKLTPLKEIRQFSGGCHKPSCTLKAMREQETKYENDVTKGRKETEAKWASKKNKK
jgi:hypothetical protein